MTIVVPVGSGPTSNLMFSPIGGPSGVKGIILDIALQVGESIIRNYIDKQISATKKSIYKKVNKGKVGNKTQRYLISQYRSRYRSNYKTYNYRKFRRGSSRGSIPTSR